MQTHLKMSTIFYVYAFCGTFFAIMLAFIMPETKGLSLSEIEDIYENGKATPSVKKSSEFPHRF